MAGLLADYGVTAVFGVPGGQILPLYYGILDEGNRIRHILMKDEIDATFLSAAFLTTLSITMGSPPCQPQATLAVVTYFMISSSFPMEYAPKLSPISLFKSI